MEIKRINGVISAYKTTRKGAAVKSEAASTAKNTDRVEFGFDTALQAAKNGISAAVKADAVPQEIAQARQTMDSVEPGDIASYIIFG
ncbi:unknown [Eubacterium sp. CAG:786]|nr:unknown [Eubacterium sp. CAG:786]